MSTEQTPAVTEQLAEDFPLRKLPDFRSVNQNFDSSTVTSPNVETSSGQSSASGLTIGGVTVSVKQTDHIVFEGANGAGNDYRNQPGDVAASSLAKIANQPLRGVIQANLNSRLNDAT